MGLHSCMELVSRIELRTGCIDTAANLRPLAPGLGCQAPWITQIGLGCQAPYIPKIKTLSGKPCLSSPAVDPPNHMYLE